MKITNQLKKVSQPFVSAKLSTTGKLVAQYTTYYKEETVEKNTILYESRDGQSMTDSPLAIFEYLLKTDKNQTFTHVWTIVPSEELRYIQALYDGYSNVVFVERNSSDYLKWLAKAEYIINNATLQSFVSIKGDQTYINTWHGTPLKTMGYDMPGNPSNPKNVVRNFFMATYLLSPNAHTTDMYLDSYRLRRNYPGQVLESGYPRMDQTFNKVPDETLKLLYDFKKELDLSKKIMLYTPTWKGTDLTNSRNDLEQIHAEMAHIRQEVGEEYNVLIKVHPFLYEQAKAFTPLLPYLIPDAMDTNKLLAIVDVLVTDYSSIFFDYLVTDKPILFYCWDDDLYTSQRGKYFEYEELPGKVAFTIDELLVNIRTVSEKDEQVEANYARFKERFVSYDDGHATQRYVDYIFYGKESSPHQFKVIENKTDKKQLLIYPGGMRNNGITSSFVNLIQNIDYDTYDVVCLLDVSSRQEQVMNINKIPKEASLLFRFGKPIYTMKEGYQDLSILMRGVPKHKESKYPDAIYEREVERLVGHKTFDVAIDFSGYSLYWSKLILASRSSKKICYMHSDMASDAERTVNGKKIHKMNLRSLFSMYHRYDYLMSVSEITRDTNLEKLSKYAAAEKFVFTPNTINPQKILGTESGSQDEGLEVLPTKVIYKEARIIDMTKAHTLYSARPDMAYTTTNNVTFHTADVVALGKVMYEEVTYYKISQDNIYKGWIAEEDIELIPAKVIEKKPVQYFGKVATTGRDGIYQYPIGIEDNVWLSNAGYLRNLYVDVSEIVVTPSSQSALVKVKGKELGYLRISKFRWSNRLNWTKQTKVPVTYRLKRRVLMTGTNWRYGYKLKRANNQPLKKELLMDYFDNQTAHEITGFKQANTASKTVSLGVLTVVYVKSLSTTLTGNWYELDTSDTGIVWVPAKDLSLSVIQDERIYQTTPNTYYADVVEKEVELFATEQDVLSGSGILVTAIPHVKVLKTMRTTKSNEYVLVEWDNKRMWLDAACVTESQDEGVMNNAKQYVPFPDTDTLNFVTMGRLSPEKNQVMLVEAFSIFYKKHQTGKLYVIGSGPEEKSIRAKVAEHGLEDQVVLVGQLDNPFRFMEKCDTFVLTSHYEGQPMVLLEAMTLGMGIISTDIPSCRYVLEDGKFGLLAQTNDAAGIANSMDEILAGKTSFATFEAEAYNQESIDSFCSYIND